VLSDDEMNNQGNNNSWAWNNSKEDAKTPHSILRWVGAMQKKGIHITTLQNHWAEQI